MSVMDSIEEKYEDEIAKLKAILAEKDKQIAALTAERDRLREALDWKNQYFSPTQNNR